MLRLTRFLAFAVKLAHGSVNAGLRGEVEPFVLSTGNMRISRRNRAIWLDGAQRAGRSLGQHNVRGNIKHARGAPSLQRDGRKTPCPL